MVAIIVGIILIGGAGYFEVRQYKNNHEAQKKFQSELTSNNTQATSTPDLSEVEKLRRELEVVKNQKPQQTTIIREKEIIREVQQPVQQPVVSTPNPITQPQTPPTPIETKKYSDQDLKNWNDWKIARKQIEQIYVNMQVSIVDGITALKVRDYNTAHAKFANGATLGVNGLLAKNNLPLISVIPETAEYKQAWQEFFTANSSYSYVFMLIVEKENSGL